MKTKENERDKEMTESVSRELFMINQVDANLMKEMFASYLTTKKMSIIAIDKKHE